MEKPGRRLFAVCRNIKVGRAEDLSPRSESKPGWARFRILAIPAVVSDRHEGASEDAILYLAQGFDDDSLLDFAHDELSRSVPAMSKIHGGTDLLPRAMAKALGGRARHGAEVRRIEQDGGGVRFAFASGGVIRYMAPRRTAYIIEGERLSLGRPHNRKPLSAIRR